jgi:hypothetical protein
MELRTILFKRSSPLVKRVGLRYEGGANCTGVLHLRFGAHMQIIRAQRGLRSSSNGESGTRQSIAVDLAQAR